MAHAVHKLKHSRSLSRMLIIGCGGTGSALIGGLPYLAHALKAAELPALRVIVADGEKVSSVNCVRQPFSESEIGLHKSIVLVNRLNLFWGLEWQASTEPITKHTTGEIDIIISCVDTRTARREIINSGVFKNCAYWLDIGNTADGGQFVLGQPRNKRNKRSRCLLRSKRWSVRNRTSTKSSPTTPWHFSRDFSGTATSAITEDLSTSRPATWPRCLWIGTLEQGGDKPRKKPPVFTASSSREAHPSTSS